MNVYQFVIVLKGETPSIISNSVETCLANDVAHAKIIAARSIPEKYNNQLAIIEILVRTFKN